MVDGGLTPPQLNASGNVTQQRYYPFGAVRLMSGTGMNTDRTFTGQRDIATLGLKDYHARMYDGMLGRFIQPDTVVPQQSQGSQAWNRFAYANNNPVLNNDPSGHCVGPFLIACIVVANAIVDYGPVVAMAAIGAIWLGGDTRELHSTPTTWEETSPRVDATLVLGAFTLPAFEPGTLCSNGKCKVPEELSTPNEIGKWGEQQVGENLPVNVQQLRVIDPTTGKLRIYDGNFLDDPKAFVEVKTSMRGVIYANQSIRDQINTDVNIGKTYGTLPTWIFVDARPSRPLITLM